MLKSKDSFTPRGMSKNVRGSRDIIFEFFSRRRESELGRECSECDWHAKGTLGRFNCWQTNSLLKDRVI